MLDGEPLGLVDLYAPEATGPAVVFVADLDPAGEQQVTVEPTGNADEVSWTRLLYASVSNAPN